MPINNHVAREYTSVEVPLPTKWVVMIVLLSLLPVYICIGAPLIWCACRGRRRRKRAERLQFSRARELRPGLAFKEWKTQRALGLDRDLGRQKFERAQLERRASLGPIDIFKQLLSIRSAIRQNGKVGGEESVWLGTSSVVRRNEDSEGLVEGMADARSHVERPEKIAKWGGDALPAYSSTPVNGNASQVDIARL